MDFEFVEINCLCSYVIFEKLPHHLSNFDEYKCTRYEYGLIVESKIGGENVIINLTYVLMEITHVHLIGWFMDRSNAFSDKNSGLARFYRKQFLTAPFIIVCYYAEKKYDPAKMKDAELNCDEMMCKQIGDKLARKTGAVKYIEYSEETGRGAKILIDEIAFAGIGKIKDDEKRRNKRKCIII